MKKKTYIQPAVQVIKLRTQGNVLLSASSNMPVNVSDDDADGGENLSRGFDLWGEED